MLHLQELVVALSHLVVQYESNFCTVALQFIEEEKNYTVPSPANAAGTADTHTPIGRDLWGRGQLDHVTVRLNSTSGLDLFFCVLHLLLTGAAETGVNITD